MDWLKKLLVGKLAGRLITVALASLGGFLIANGISDATVNNWIEATTKLLGEGLPILVAIVLDHLQHKKALDATPPKVLNTGK